MLFGVTVHDILEKMIIILKVNFKGFYAKQEICVGEKMKKQVQVFS